MSVQVAKDGNNCYIAGLMIEIMKVWQNMGTIEQVFKHILTITTTDGSIY